MQRISFRAGVPFALIVSLAPCAGLVPQAARAGYRDDVGYTALQAELGSATPTGAGVVVSQVEAPVQEGGPSTWVPYPGDAEFVGKTITDVTGAPSGQFSSHATNVGHIFYGTATSLAPAITSIFSYEADTWIGGDFLWTTALRQPKFSGSRITNHSWVGDAGTATSEALRRLDWVIETDDAVNVVGHGNGATQTLLTSAYNVIAVGRSSGIDNQPTTAIDAIYVAGRAHPQVVVPAPSLSDAAPDVSAIAALLVEVGHANASLSTDPVSTGFVNRAGDLVRNAERAEVIKAALMAGADRVTRNSTSPDLARYRATAADQTTNRLDRRYGAGQVNVRNSYWIIASGEQNSVEDGGTGSGAAPRGFDYDPAFGGSGGTNSMATYPLPTAATPQLLTAALVWHLDVVGGTNPLNFNSTAYVRDLELAVLDVTNPSSPVTVFVSQSTVDNTENAWLVVPANAQYALRVTRGPGSSFNYDYGIAWQLMPDSDGDGAHDGQDNCIQVPNGPIVPDAGGNSQLDSDGDGYGNVCDADLDNSGGLVNFTDLAAFRSLFGTASPIADIDGSGGLVNFTDLALFRAMFGKPPGPSAYAP